jgi:hypothetical protein
MTNLKTFLVGAAALAVAATSASALEMQRVGPANSKTGELANIYAPNGTFYLENKNQVERVRFAATGDHMLCVAEPVRSGVLPNGNPEPAALQVMWRDKAAIVEPGRCLQFEARYVELTPADSLAPGHIIQGEIMENYAY